MDIREALYPIGFVATFLFATRFIVQWAESESKGKSVVTPSFWVISLLGNLALCFHTFIQVQYPFCLIQALNAALAWRNLNLLKSNKLQLRSFVIILAVVATVITLLFIAQGLFFFGYIDWVRSPTIPWEEGTGAPIGLLWHIFGFLGAFIFALRFWLQWWGAEQRSESYIGASFWWTSLIGASIAVIYFSYMRDWVNIAGYGLGIIPYARNLVLLRKQS
jgi:lipid-A-disaccharide synthase-like uncharacterized protein